MSADPLRPEPIPGEWYLGVPCSHCDEMVLYAPDVSAVMEALVLLTPRYRARALRQRASEQFPPGQNAAVSVATSASGHEVMTYPTTRSCPRGGMLRCLIIAVMFVALLLPGATIALSPSAPLTDFPTEAQAQQNCPAAAVVWLNLPTGSIT